MKGDVHDIRTPIVFDNHNGRGPGKTWQTVDIATEGGPDDPYLFAMRLYSIPIQALATGDLQLYIFPRKQTKEDK